MEKRIPNLNRIPNPKMEDYATLAASFRHAWNGIVRVFRTELNFRRHLVMAFVVIVVGIALDWDFVKWGFATLAMMAVLGTEMINTAIEYTWNHLEPNHHPVVGIIKDVMAGAVLIASVGAAIIGCLLVFS